MVIVQYFTLVTTMYQPDPTQISVPPFTIQLSPPPDSILAHKVANV